MQVNTYINISKIVSNGTLNFTKKTEPVCILNV